MATADRTVAEAELCGGRTRMMQWQKRNCIRKEGKEDHAIMAESGKGQICRVAKMKECEVKLTEQADWQRWQSCNN